MKSKIAPNIMVSVKGQYGLGLVAWLDMDLHEEQDSSKHNGKCKRPVWAEPCSVARYGPG